MNYFGEIISITVAFSWTVTALFAEVGSKRLGSLQLNVIRMLLSLVMLGGCLWCFTGTPYPQFADANAWLWLSLSGFVGLLPVQFIYNHWFPFRAVVHDTCSPYGCHCRVADSG